MDWLNRRLAFLRKQREEREQLESTLDEEVISADRQPSPRVYYFVCFQAGSEISELTDQMREFIELLVRDQSAKLVAWLMSQVVSEEEAAAIAEYQRASLEQLKKDGQGKLVHHRQHLQVPLLCWRVYFYVCPSICFYCLPNIICLSLIACPLLCLFGCVCPATLSNLQ